MPTVINTFMKILLLLLALSFTSVQAQAPLTCTEFVQKSGYWAIVNKSDQLVFCFGIDTTTGKPTCTKVPEQYVVIELPNNLQR